MLYVNSVYRYMHYISEVGVHLVYPCMCVCVCVPIKHAVKLLYIPLYARCMLRKC
jgi:hypothetical protein